MDKVIRSAVSSTRGIVMCYDEEFICAVFHSSSSGMTESSANIWGGKLPYLRAVTTGEETSYSEKNITLAKLEGILRAYGYKPDTSKMMFAVKRTDSGRVSRLTVFGVELGGDRARSIFGLRSSDFDISIEGDTVKFSVRGYGHGVGMSQYGAADMANRGYRFDEILSHYYSGITLYKG